MSKKKMNFYCLFPGLKNFEFYKTPGSITYYLSKNPNYYVTMVGYDNDDDFSNFENLDNYEIKIINRKFNTDFLNYFLIIKFLIKNAKNIDILNCFHYRISTTVFFLVYKIFNRNGIIYHTNDIDYNQAVLITDPTKGIKYILARTRFLWLYKYLIDFGSVETKKVLDVFRKSNEIYEKKLIYLPCISNPNKLIEEKKINQIISVGRIGSQQKASEIVLESFKKAMEITKNKDWVLKMVGQVSEDFKEYIDTFLSENPSLKNSIIFTEFVEDRNELYKIYSESKILLLPSRHGSCEIVFEEALFYSNYLLVTDVGIGKYLIDISNFGKVVEIDNIEDITQKLVDAIENYDEYYNNNTLNLKKLAEEEFGPTNQIKKIDERIKNIKNNKT